MKSIFKDKLEKSIAIIFSVFYIIMLILNIDVRLPFVHNFRYIVNSLVIDIMPLTTPVFVLVFLLCLNKEYNFKKWLLPVAFGVKVLIAFLTLCGSFSTIRAIFLTPEYILVLLCSCLIFVAIVFMFIGTLSNFRHINFIKYGALSCAVLNLVTLIIDFISVGGFKYLQSVPVGVPVVKLSLLITSLASTLFYAGIFILFNSKKCSDLV